jgi:hypothetical protein
MKGFFEIAALLAAATIVVASPLKVGKNGRE